MMVLQTQYLFQRLPQHEPQTSILRLGLLPPVPKFVT